MKKTLRFMMVALLAVSVTVSSCKKSNADEENKNELSTHGEDQARVDNETDAATNDANAAIESFSAFEGKPNGTENVLDLPCDATIALDSTATLRRITITYNGSNCAGTRTRTGQVILTMPLAQHWVNAHAVLTVTFANLKITRISDNKSITINGVHHIENVTGGRLWQLASVSPIIHDITSSGMVVTFDNGTSRTWQVAKRRTFTYDNGIVFATSGTHTDGNTTGICEWGTTRFGTAFVTRISSPLTFRQDCNFRLTGGEVVHERLAANVVVTFGLNSAGNPTSCPGLAYYYYKLVWTGANGAVATFILPY